MSIKLKLLISYLAMLIVPIVLSALAAALLVVAYTGDIRNINLHQNPIMKSAEKSSALLDEVESTATTNPEKLTDKRYLDDVDNKLSIINTGIAVKKGNLFTYTSKFLNSTGVFSKLPSVGRHEKDIHDEEGHNPVLVGNKLFNIRQFNFYFKDNTPGQIYFITDIGPIGEFARNIIYTLIPIVIIILVVTNGLLTYLVSRSILKPLSLLKAGTQQIKEGNLNFEVKSSSKDEIGEVCDAFEEMRRKLKDSIELQLQYEENRKELISNISHDLKTPMTAIKGHVEGIIDGVVNSPEKLDKYAKTIYSKIMDMDKLIEDLFLFSKLDLKRVPFNFEKVDIKNYFRYCIDELGFDLEKESIDLHFNADISDKTFVVADREKLKRVIVNIIENSVKYMDKANGKINIRLNDDNDVIVVQIEDNGKGISKESIPYIFERFYRADSSRNTSTGGSGLGLAIVKQIVEEHGGKIWAESELGVGTSIFFTLKKA